MATHDYDIANGSGAAVRADLNNVLDAIASNNSAAVSPATTFAFQWWYDTANDILYIRNSANTVWIPVYSFHAGNEQIPYSRGVPQDIEEVSLALNDATPDVSGGIRFTTNSGVATTITNFVGSPAAGWRILLRAADGNTTIGSSLTKTGMTIPLVIDDYLEFEYDGATWNQIGGTVGMGQYVALAAPDVIGDTPSPASAAWQDVDVSDDGVRKGACAARIRAFTNSNVASGGVRVRKNGAAHDTTSDLIGLFTVGRSEIMTAIVALDDDAIFEVEFASTWTALSNVWSVTGYFI